uniref:Aldehyde dehydrogenase domain-containing protein n=1 Tax=Aplanochytrium stocchinoi TaxID=215587 RepID=A0A7S3V078_9STRA|mmetsp:Transcript_875/g.1211  ORF Transcript_875/g.1211 Transcript_875/m.1211 type:complete len:473 (+) Transcript_875:304-1722(+)
MVQGVEVQDGYLLDRNPADGSLIRKVKMSTSEEIEAAVKKAKAAQLGWALTPLEKRIDMLKKCCANLKEKSDELAEMITSEMGKVNSEAIDEVQGAVDKDRFLDLIKQANLPEKVTESDSDTEAIIVREPLGVVAVLAPWNFPADEILLLALPALAAGNAVIVKPSEVVPLTGAMVVDSLIRGLPEGVAQLLQGDGSVGAALTKSDIQMVAMTGSSATGKRIMSNAADNLKRLVLELGGKDPMVVFADADLDKAAEDAVTFSLYNCGQVCCSIERIYVEKSIKSKFEEKCVGFAKAWKAGKGTEEDSKIGPMVSSMQKDIVSKHVDDASQKGARKLFSGEAPSEGNFYPATVLTDITKDMLIATEETFGPVVCISEFDGSESEAVRLSNDTEYGLSASVYTQDLEKGTRVAALVKAGQVGVNSWPLGIAPAKCPWIGTKGSGFGYHSGMDGWRQFSVPKSIISPTKLPDSKL